MKRLFFRPGRCCSPQFLLCFPYTPAFSSSNFLSSLTPPSLSSCFPILSDSYRSAHPLNKNEATELQKGKKTGKESGRMTGGGRQQWRNQAGRLRGMKATTGKSVFSGLVERWPSLRGTWTTSSPQCSRYQSVLRSDLHHSSRLQTQDFFFFLQTEDGSGFLSFSFPTSVFCLSH